MVQLIFQPTIKDARLVLNAISDTQSFANRANVIPILFFLILSQCSCYSASLVIYHLIPFSIVYSIRRPLNWLQSMLTLDLIYRVKRSLISLANATGSEMRHDNFVNSTEKKKKNFKKLHKIKLLLFIDIPLFLFL